MTPATNSVFSLNPTATPTLTNRNLRQQLAQQGRKRRVHQRLKKAVRRLKRGRRIPSQKLPIRRRQDNTRHPNAKWLFPTTSKEVYRRRKANLGELRSNPKKRGEKGNKVVNPASPLLKITLYNHGIIKYGIIHREDAELSSSSGNSLTHRTRTVGRPYSDRRW